MVEATAGSDCFTRYSSAKTRPNGAIWLWGDIICAAGAVQVLNTGLALNMLDCHTWLSAMIPSPLIPNNDLNLPGQANDGFITPSIPAGANASDDQKYLCVGDWYTGIGWDGISARTGGQSYAKFWKNFTVDYVNCFIFLSSTGALQFKNGTAVPVVGHYKILVFPQTGKRVTLP